MIREIITAYAPAKPGWIIIYDGRRYYLLPEHEFTNIMIEAGKKFRNLAAVAPYEIKPWVITWRMNQRTYEWVTRQLAKKQEEYEWLLRLRKTEEEEEETE